MYDTCVVVGTDDVIGGVVVVVCCGVVVGFADGVVGIGSEVLVEVLVTVVELGVV